MGRGPFITCFQIGDVRPIRPWGLRPLFFALLMCLMFFAVDSHAGCVRKTSYDGSYGGPSAEALSCTQQMVQGGQSLLCTSQWNNGTAAHCGSHEAKACNLLE